MIALTGNEFFLVTGLDNLGRPSGEQEQVTTGQVAALAGSGLTSNPRVISTGTVGLTLPTDTTIAWNSASASIKTQVIPAPTGSGRTLTIVDVYGVFHPLQGATLYNINITPVSGLIADASSLPVAIDGQSVTIMDISPSIGWIMI